jgi:hypothetical protein
VTGEGKEKKRKEEKEKKEGERGLHVRVGLSPIPFFFLFLSYLDIWIRYPHLANHNSTCGNGRLSFNFKPPTYINYNITYHILILSFAN